MTYNGIFVCASLSSRGQLGKLNFRDEGLVLLVHGNPLAPGPPDNTQNWDIWEKGISLLQEQIIEADLIHTTIIMKKHRKNTWKMQILDPVHAQLHETSTKKCK